MDRITFLATAFLIFGTALIIISCFLVSPVIIEMLHSLLRVNVLGIISFIVGTISAMIGLLLLMVIFISDGRS